MVEVWFSQNNKWLRLPVPPSSYSLKTESNNVSVVVESVGELNILGESKLSQITLDSFFPSQYYTFCTYADFPKPNDCIAQFEKWRTSKKPIRLVLTGTKVNDLFSIESFEFGEKDGTKDIYFTIVLKQYKITALNQAIVGTHGAAYTLKDANAILGSNFL